jgi:uncharacterized membrane protein YoaK (UPF0700 family)
MPVAYIRRLTASERTIEANRHLGLSLAFIAGATNAGGFLAVGQYTSHMTGIVASMSDNFVLGQYTLAVSAFVALFVFVSGAACSAILINWARRKQMRSEYALALLLEAGLLIIFGVLGGLLYRKTTFLVPVATMLLCFIMGLQNAIITKISRAEIRTTHITGMVTDIGIELGKRLYWNRSKDASKVLVVAADRQRLAVQSAFVGSFFVGGLLGAFGFKYIGFSSTIGLAAILLVFAGVPIFDEINLNNKRRKKST